MPNVRVFVPIRRGYHGESYLLETEFNYDFLPRTGDSIHPLKNDSESALTFEIKRPYWDESGRTCLEIGQFIIDPEDDGRHLPRTWNLWFTDIEEKDLVELLMKNGWKNYEPK